MSYLEEIKDIKEVIEPTLLKKCRTGYDYSYFKKIAEDAANGKLDDDLSQIVESILKLYISYFIDSITNHIMSYTNARPLKLTVMQKMLMDDLLSVLVDRDTKIDFSKYMIDLTGGTDTVSRYYKLNINKANNPHQYLSGPITAEKEVCAVLHTLGTRNTVLMLVAVEKILGE